MIDNYELKVTENIFGDIEHYGYKSGCVFIRHRVDGPAIIGGNGRMYWIVHGKFYHDTKLYCEICEYTLEETVMMLLKYGDQLPFGA